MIQTEFKDLVFTFAQESSCSDVAQIILFGSVAAGTADNRSDVDLLIILDTEKDVFDDTDTRKKISSSALTLGKKYDRNLQLIFTNRLFSGIDKYLIEKALSEGIILYSKTPRIYMDGNNLQQFLLVTFNSDNLDHNNRQKLTRSLYGYKTKKEVNGRIYRTEKQGIVKELEGRKLGTNIFIMPKTKGNMVKKVLEQHNAVYSAVNIWLSEDSRIKLLGK